MAGGSDDWKFALLDIRHGRSHQPCTRAGDDKISGSAERKSLVAKTLGKTLVALSQLQCSRKSTRLAVSKQWKNQFKNEVLLHRYGLVIQRNRRLDRANRGAILSRASMRHLCHKRAELEPLRSARHGG